MGLLLALLAVYAATVLGVTSENWVGGDFWGLVFDRRGTPAPLFADHAGHLVVVHRLAARWVHATSGLGDLGVAHGSLRVLAWSALAGSVWWVVRSRSRDRAVALVAFALVLFHGGAGFVQPWLIGNPIAYATGILAAWWVGSRRPDSWREVAVLAVLLLTAVLSTTSGLLATLAVTLVVLVTPRLRGWWLGVVPALAVQAVWRLLEPTPARDVDLSPGALVRLPVDAVRLVHAGVARFVGLGDVVGWVVLVALSGLLVLWARRRRLGATDVVLIVWCGAFAVASLLVRVGAGQSGVRTVRYGVAVTLLLITLVASHLRRPSNGWVAALAGVTAVALVTVNATTLVSGDQGLRWFTERTSSSRAVVEQAAVLLLDGHAVVDNASIDRPDAGVLTSTSLGRIVADGWRPRPRSNPSAREAALGDLQVDARPSDRLPAGVVCVEVLGDREVDVDVGGPYWVELGAAGASVTTGLHGDHGVQALPRVRGELWRIEVAAVGRAVLRVPAGDDARLCAAGP